ncbi:MAG: hypothetical protein HN341_18080 [Verrucomicrobia bacterium]|nr:hypothetical protein [Verrucomicrobiota bacterium]
MPFAVVLMGLSVLLMLTGVLPVRGGGQDAVFLSPVLAFILALLGLSTFACAVRRRVSLRGIGFHLTHFSVVLIMIGALVGVIFEKKFDCRLQRNAAKPLQKIQMGDGSIVDLGFGLSLSAFRLEKYPPNLVVRCGEDEEVEHRLVEGSEISVSGEMVKITRVVPRAAISDVKLAGTPELVVGDEPSPLARISIDGDQPSEMALPDGSTLFIARVYNNLPTMQMGHQFRETSFPSRPGIIAHVIASNSMAIIALEADKPAKLLSPSDPALAPEFPTLRYTFPDILSLAIEPSEDPAAPFVAELLMADGIRQFLIEGGGRFGSYQAGEDSVLTLGRAQDRRYEADLQITRHGEAPLETTLVINKPLDIARWRLYLNSYDAKAHEHITITLRNDPGDTAVVIGLLGLMIGTALIFFLPKRKSS